ncbi:universal stress protein [Mycobacterium avium]|nr:universal stress protein [Mycobacterium avium subsp. hominissuis 100]MBZ4509367.1 universal stress protein [Mycobacterium avium subsp. hominissuis]PAZ99985.1 universal stress protein [Mycobacterium avium]MBZ4572270.1 universal stress protein [Mycobacterium avium subsp. hominissuis]PBA04749.1 universal stress protein [Mycobacterium avium]
MKEVAMSTAYPAPAIVVGVDGSRAAMHAAVWAIDEAVGRDIPLRLVYVIDPHGAPGGHGPDTRLAAARAALADAHRAVDAFAQPVKVETEILWGNTAFKLLEQSRSAVMLCVGQIGLNHACHGGPAIATSLVRSALCPVAVVQQAPSLPAAARVSGVVAEVDNGTVLRHAFEEARLRGVGLCAVGNPSARVELERRLARWMRLYPDVQAESAVLTGGVEQHLRAEHRAGRLLVTDAYRAEALCHAGHSVLAVRCGNL